MKSHYLFHYRLALASGFVHFAGAIAEMYRREFGEEMPPATLSETPHAHPTGKV